MSARQGIHEDALQAMLQGGAVREVLVSRHNERWTQAIRLGESHRGRRFAEGMGIKGFGVEL